MIQNVGRKTGASKLNINYILQATSYMLQSRVVEVRKQRPATPSSLPERSRSRSVLLLASNLAIERYVPAKELLERVSSLSFELGLKGW